MTAPRYVGRFELKRDFSGYDIVLTGAPDGMVYSVCHVFRPIRDDEVESERRAKWIAAALNAYNQPQEQEQKQEVPK